jgi:hypothetical protein
VVEEVAGQTADGNVRSAKQSQYEASRGQKDAEKDQQFPEFGHVLLARPDTSFGASCATLFSLRLLVLTPISPYAHSRESRVLMSG